MRKNKTAKMEERVEELTRRIDNLATQLHTSDSEYGLHQIPELKKRLDDLVSRLAMNDTELRIYRNSVSLLQGIIYPLAEFCEKCRKNSDSKNKPGNK